MWLKCSRRHSCGVVSHMATTSDKGASWDICIIGDAGGWFVSPNLSLAYEWRVFSYIYITKYIYIYNN